MFNVLWLKRVQQQNDDQVLTNVGRFWFLHYVMRTYLIILYIYIYWVGENQLGFQDFYFFSNSPGFQIGQFLHIIIDSLVWFSQPGFFGEINI